MLSRETATRVSGAVSLSVIALALTACGGGGMGRTASAPVASNQNPGGTDVQNNAAPLAKDSIVVIDVSSANQGGQVAVFDPAASGNVAPARIIGGASTQIQSGVGVGADANEIVVANGVPRTSHPLFASAAQGNVAPTLSLQPPDGCKGTATTPAADGTIYLATACSIGAYPRGATTASRTITNAHFVQVTGVATDGAGNLYVADWQGNAIYEYAPSADGAATPIRTITTGLSPYRVAVASDGSIVAGMTDFKGNDAIAVFAPGASGAATAARVILGPNTGLMDISGVALDSAGDIVVANFCTTGGSVTFYAPGANGNVAPIRTIAGNNTGFDVLGPYDVAIVH